ncbi:MAG: mercury transporter MerT [Gammaproteobacteria bacterium]|nr:mercury transporter MerT [Gammaproteobacteria bacterium]
MGFIIASILVNSRQQMKKDNMVVGATALGAILATACCVLPFSLFSIGITGAWLGNLAALAPYRPYFILVATALLLAGIFTMRKKRTVAACEGGDYCASKTASVVQISVLVVSALIIALAVIWPVVVSWLLGPVG